MPLSLHLHLDLHLLLSFSFLFFTPTSNADETTPANYFCSRSSQMCGDVNISYPFWQINSPDSSTVENICGFSVFGLYCPNKGPKPTLNLSGDNFIVKDINYSDYTLTLVDADTQSTSCPRVRGNITLNDTFPFIFSPLDMTITFYFNCTTDPSPSVFSMAPIECLRSGENMSYILTSPGYDVGLYDWSLSCEEIVAATVMKGSISDPVNDTFDEAINNGFVLNWMNKTDCPKCEASGGMCGFDNSTLAREFRCFCNNGKVAKYDCSETKSILKTIAIVSSFIAFGLLVTVMVITYFLSRIRMRFWEKESSNQQKIEAFIKSFGLLAPRRFSYSDIKKMTNSFQDKLGQGGYGGVYKGKLLDGRLVAVKLLSSSKGSGEDFINEVASISKTSHVNVVALLGFCFQHNKRALVYEFMPNGSLDKLIFDVQQLGLEKLSEIAIGIARGLEYLHRGCSTRILHLDIKPHNILLDEDFTPKIADFGLAKLCKGKESKISMSEARGTIGYIAPEVFCRNFGNVSHKSDVYSYGMMILETVGGRNKCDIEVSDCSEMYFPQYLYNQLKQDENLGMMQGILTREQIEITRKMIIVGLWCIQTDPSQRPSMNKVLEMLEGSIETLQVPPRPFASSPPCPSRIPAEATSLVESSQ